MTRNEPNRSGSWRNPDSGGPPADSGYKLGKELAFAENGNGCAFLGSGFSYPENWGVWTIGTKARVALPIAARTPLSLWLEFQTYVRNAGPTAGFRISVNGSEIGMYSPLSTGIWGEVYESHFEIPSRVLDGKILQMELAVINGRDPTEDPNSRPIGIGLRRMRVSGL